MVVLRGSRWRRPHNKLMQHRAVASRPLDPQSLRILGCFALYPKCSRSIGPLCRALGCADFWMGQVFGSALKRQCSSEKVLLCVQAVRLNRFSVLGQSGLKVSGSSAEKAVGCPVIFGLAESLNQKCPAGCLNLADASAEKKSVLPVSIRLSRLF